MQKKKSNPAKKAMLKDMVKNRGVPSHIDLTSGGGSNLGKNGIF